MREIKFRMKDYQGYWYYFGLGNATYTTTETLGQYTGRKDHIGTPIYEGDIIKQTVYSQAHGAIYKYWVVKWDVKCSCFVATSAKDSDWLCNLCSKTNYHAVVAGNIHDNPELLTKTKQR